MTESVAAQTPVTEHVGNGVTTSFAYTFQLLDSADLVVELDGVVQTSGYTVSGVGVLAGGSVLFTTAPASDVSVLLRRSTDLSRSTSYTYAGDLSETVVDADFNRLWHAMQERAEVEGRALRAPVGETVSALPPATTRRGKLLAFDTSTGDPVLSSFTLPQVANAVAAAYASGLVLPSINVLDFGAVGDGITDDTAAIQAAINLASGANIYLPSGTYRVTAPLLMATQGLTLVGASQLTSTLLIDQTSGPGISVSSPYCRIGGIRVQASATRAVYTTGSAYELAVGLFGVQIYNNGGFLTQTRLDRVWSIGHPNNGFYMGGEGADSMFINCAAYSNRGHGFYFDGRTLLGGTTSRCGLVSLVHCRALDNGGNAVFADDTAAPCYRMWFHNFETITNAWNTSISGLINAEIRLGGENQHLNQCAQSDMSGDTRTTTDQGYPRLAKSLLSAGIYLGSNTRGVTLTQNRFISTRRGVQTNSTMAGLHLYVRGAYFTQQVISSGATNQLFGFDIGSGYKCLDIEVESGAPVNFMVSTPTTGGRAKIGNTEGLIYGNSTGGVFARNGYVDATISSSAVNAQSRYINLLTPSAVNLVQIAFAGSGNLLPAGETLHFYNASAYTITLKHGTGAGYIRTKSGTDVTVLAGQSFSVFTDPSGNPFEV